MRGVSIIFPSEERVAYGGERVDVVLIGKGFEVEMESSYPKRSIITTSPVNLFAYNKGSNKARSFLTTDPAGFDSAFMNVNYRRLPQWEFEVSVKVRAASIEEARAKVTVR